MPKINQAVANNDHTLTIELANRHRIIFDLRPRLQTIRFRGLTDLKSFQAVRVEHGSTLVWNSLCQITIDEIIDLIDW